MTSIITTLRNAAAKRSAYNRTVAEISHMRRETGWDLGIFPEDAEKIARKSVYGA